MKALAEQPVGAEVDKQPQRIAAMFSSIAPHYDLLNHLLSCNLDRMWRAVAAASVPVHRGESLLDVCAGTGDMAAAFARRHPQLDPLVLTDFAAPMIRLAAAKWKRTNGLPPASWLTADALRMPFRSGSFDLATCAFGVRNFADLDAGLREMHRVLRPDGRVVILEFCHSDGTRLPAPLRWFVRHAVPVIGRFVSHHDSAYSYLPQSILGFVDRAGMEAALRRAGFVRVCSRDLTFGVATLVVGQVAGGADVVAGAGTARDSLSEV